MRKERLRRIIRESVESQDENISKEDISAGKKLAATEVGKALFDKMDDSPEIQKAIEKLVSDLGGSGFLSEKDDASGGAAITGGVLGTGAGAKAGFAVEAALLKGAPAIIPAKTAIATMLATTGLPIAGFVGGALVGYLLYKGVDKLLSKNESRRKNMKITKRQLKRIIREEYSKLRRQGLIREMNHDDFEPRDTEPLDDPAYCAEKDVVVGEYGESVPPGCSPEWQRAYDKAYEKTMDDYEEYLADQEPRQRDLYSRRPSYEEAYYDPAYGDSPSDYID